MWRDSIAVTAATASRDGASRAAVRFRAMSGIAAVSAAAISLLLGANRSFWFDEGYSVALADRSWGELVGLTAVDVHPPLYYMALKAWIGVFGDAAWSYRALSAVFLGLTVLCGAWVLGMLIGSRRTAMALPLLALSPMLLRYGYEVRMYSMAAFWCMLGTGLLLKAVRADAGRPRRERIAWWALYALVVALGMYTLYLTALTWATHAALLAARSWPNRRRGARAWRWMLAYAGSVALYLPWMPAFFGQLDHPSLPGLNTRMNLSTLADLTGALFAGVDASHTSTIESCAILMALVSLAVLAAGIARDARRGTRRGAPADRDARALGLTAVMFLGPLGLVVAYTALAEWVGGGFFMIHYIVPFTPFLACAAIVAVTSDRRDDDAEGRLRMRATAWATMLILSLVGVANAGTIGNYNFEQRYVPRNDAVGAAVACSPDEPVVAAQDYAYIDMYFYFRGCGADGYLLLKSGDIAYRGGYAPIVDMGVQIRSLSDLHVERFTLVSADTDPSSLPSSHTYAIDGSPRKVGNRLIATYQRLGQNA